MSKYGSLMSFLLQQRFAYLFVPVNHLACKKQIFLKDPPNSLQTTGSYSTGSLGGVGDV